MSDTVMELSAMLVDRMTFLNPASGLTNTRYCSSNVMVEWRHRMQMLVRSPCPLLA